MDDDVPSWVDEKDPPWVLDTRDPDEWRERLFALNLPVGAFEQPFHGWLSYQATQQGLRFSVMKATGQEIGGSEIPTHQADAIWLCYFIEGAAWLIEDGKTEQVQPGDIVFGRTNKAPVVMRFGGNFRALFLGAPKATIDPRLVAPLSLRLCHLRSGSDGIVHIFGAMLDGLAAVLDQTNNQPLHRHQLRPIQIALTEFLLSCIVVEEGRRALGGSEGKRAAHLHSICQAIEAYLGKPDLSSQFIAAREGVSQRYLQKLFTERGQTFMNYVRARRLARCASDLASPLYAQQPITQIAFRWGFNSSAHFSRAFREVYHLSPREYRLQNLPNTVDDALDQEPEHVDEKPVSRISIPR